MGDLHLTKQWKERPVTATDTVGHSADKASIQKKVKRENVKFLRLQFTDILGAIKNVEVPDSQFDEALDGKIMFDGSSIEGFVRIEESDMYLKPDLKTFQVFPWESSSGDKVGRLICDIYKPNSVTRTPEPFDGCPRTALRRVVEMAAKLGFEMKAGPEPEFFLFQTLDGNPTTETHDTGGYFDLTPVDLGEDVRRQIVLVLEKMGFHVEAAHHEVAAGQHEIDFRYDDVMTTADSISTFRFVVKNVAMQNGLHATFMPKPIHGINGSGMHTHQSMFKNGTNAFYDKKAERNLSKTCLYYIGGLLRHAKGFCAITNPLVNSYKRMVPGYEAPTNLAWSEKNRSPLIRVPASRGNGTRVELRMPDPACNPYLALAVMLRAGLDGIENKINPPAPVDKNIYEMSHRERRKAKIDELPGDLSRALDALEKDSLMQDTLGDHILKKFVEAKRAEWHDYVTQVTPWETQRYLTSY